MRSKRQQKLKASGGICKIWPRISKAASISPPPVAFMATMRKGFIVSPPLAEAARVPLLATNDVLYHDPSRRRLQDVLTCIRETCTIDEAGFRLDRNAERHLKSPEEMARLFADYPRSDRQHG